VVTPVLLLLVLLQGQTQQQKSPQQPYSSRAVQH
jgi:hypothetical protein